jgi:hypothetical protein
LQSGFKRVRRYHSVALDCRQQTRALSLQVWCEWVEAEAVMVEVLATDAANSNAVLTELSVYAV